MKWYVLYLCVVARGFAPRSPERSSGTGEGDRAGDGRISRKILLGPGGPGGHERNDDDKSRLDLVG